MASDATLFELFPHGSIPPPSDYATLDILGSAGITIKLNDRKSINSPAVGALIPSTSSSLAKNNLGQRASTDFTDTQFRRTLGNVVLSIFRREQSVTFSDYLLIDHMAIIPLVVANVKAAGR